MKNIEYKLLNDVLLLRAFTGVAIVSEDILQISRAAENKSIEILKDAGGADIGYVVWASVNKYSVLNMMNNAVLPKYFYEFGEGNICFILNIFIASGCSSDAIVGLKSFIRKKRIIAYYKKGKSCFLVREKNKFFRKKTKSHFHKITVIEKAVA